MFRNNIANMIIALFLSILLWVYVTGVMDPQTSRVCRDVPVTLIGTEELAEQGLAIADAEDLTIDITLEGSRSKMHDIDTEDVTVTADVSGLGKGRNTVGLEIQTPNDTELKKADPRELILTVESLVSKDMDIVAEYEGSFSDGTEAGETIIEPSSVTVTGAASNVSRVDRLQVDVNAAEMEKNGGYIECDIVPLDKKGAPVDLVTLSSEKATVSTSILYEKTVPFKVNVTGLPANDMEIAGVEAPDQLTLKGAEVILTGITELSMDINAAGITETTTYDIAPDLPKGVIIADASKKGKIIVKLTAKGSSTYTFGAENVKIENLADGLTAEAADTKIICTATASSDVLAKLSETDFTLTADAEGVGADTVQVPLIAKCNNSAVSVTVEPKQITLVITETE